MNNRTESAQEIEPIDEVIETEPESGGLVSAGVNAGVADQLYLAENIHKMIEAQNKIRIAILGLAQPGDWVIFGKDDKAKAEIGFAGAARIASTLGISYTNWTASKEKGTDEKGEWYRWEFECDAVIGKRLIRVYGRAGSRDKFFGKQDGEYKALHDVDEGNIKQAARRAAMKEGTKVLCGLHHMDPEFLKTKGVKLSSASGYSFKGKEESAAEAETASVVVENVTVKQGTAKNGKTWTKYTVTDSEGVAYSTFSETMATEAKKAKESKTAVSITFSKGAYGPELSSINGVTANQ